ncbi:MAG: tetratricopeptide repeat protein [Pyrinomonadaceae bacterium]
MLNRECQLRVFRIFYLTTVVCAGLFFAACSSTSTFLTKGEEYLQKRKFHDALMQFRSAAESDPDSSAAHWGLARAHENLGQFNDTLEELRKAVELDETNLEAKAKLGNYFLLVQPPMIVETEAIRDEILAADPSFIEGHILSASIMAAQGRPDEEVVRAVNEAIDLNPTRIESYISLERLYMTREKPAEAETAIKRGIEAAPAAIAGYTEYGRFLMYASRDNEAEAQFQRAVAIDGSSIEAREAIAEFYLTSRQIPKAEQAYLELVDIQENSPESRLVLADFYSKINRNDEAIAVLDKVLTDAPEYVLARYRLGQMHLDRKDTAKVHEQLDALFAINDHDVEALMLRARLSLHEGRSDEAVKDIEDVLKKQPSGRDALFLMAQARLALGHIQQANAYITDLTRYHPNYLKAGLLKIQSAVTQGDSQDALRLSNELIEKANAATPNAENDPQSIADLRVRGVSSRGLAYLELGNFPQAKADLDEVVRLSPRSSSALVNRAKVSLAERNSEAALELYEKALELDAENFDAVSGIVATSVKLGRPAYAHAKINELIAASGGKADVVAALKYLNSTVYSAEKKTAEAEAELTAAIELNENYLPAYSAYADLLVSLGRTDEAAAQYRTVIEKRPSGQAYTMLGILEEARGNTAEAETSYRKALEIAPEAAIAANNLAWLIAENQGNLDEALRLATGAVSKNQSVAGFYDTLGWVYYKKGLSSPAVEQLKKAVTMDEANAKKLGTVPNPSYRVRLGMALAKAGDKASARREVEASLRSGDLLSQREVRDAKTVLASL